jgi:hypothetical protein
VEQAAWRIGVDRVIKNPSVAFAFMIMLYNFPQESWRKDCFGQVAIVVQYPSILNPQCQRDISLNRYVLTMKNGPCDPSAMAAIAHVVGYVCRFSPVQKAMRRILVDSRFEQDMFFLDTTVYYTDRWRSGCWRVDLNLCCDFSFFTPPLLRSLYIVRFCYFEDVWVV